MESIKLEPLEEDARENEGVDSINECRGQLEYTKKTWNLRSVYGSKFKEAIGPSYVLKPRLSKIVSAALQTMNGTDSAGKDATDPVDPLPGPLAVFSLIVPARMERLSYRDQKMALRSAIANSPHFKEGYLLETCEKGVLFPVVHFMDDRESVKRRLKQGTLLEESALGSNFSLHQGVYREIRSIVPEMDLPEPKSLQNFGYMLIGFKSLERSFNQVMVDTWKDWTGARFIYMYLHDDLGLSRISFYHREAPHELDLFMYIVLVECQNVTEDNHVRLLDFAQRLRVERMTGYISVYRVASSLEPENGAGPDSLSVLLQSLEDSPKPTKIEI